VSESAEPVDRGALRQLLRRHSEELTRIAAAFGAAHGLHQTDVAALAVIAQAPTPLGPAALADALQLSRPATTALLDRLEGVGHVVRRADPADRRRAIVELQPTAHELAAAFFGPLGNAYEQAMDDYSDDELRVVHRFLQDVIDVSVATRERLRA
jgi:DNA-binding MarR family transcriptional regulator